MHSRRRPLPRFAGHFRKSNPLPPPEMPDATSSTAKPRADKAYPNGSCDWRQARRIYLLANAPDHEFPNDDMSVTKLSGPTPRGSASHTRACRARAETVAIAQPTRSPDPRLIHRPRVSRCLKKISYYGLL